MLIIEDEEDNCAGVKFYDENNPDEEEYNKLNQNYVVDTDGNAQLTNCYDISFENAEHIYLIEYNFHTIDYKLPKNPKHIKWIKKLNETEKIDICNKINIAIDNAMEEYYRLDGIIASGKQLVIFTEFNIIELTTYTNSNSNKYEIQRVVKIREIDFITLTRDGSTMILHLLPKYKKNNNENLNINSNLIVHSQQLENAVSCICSTHLYDKPKGEINGDTIPVVMINEKFEVIDILKEINNDEEYK